MATLTKQKVTSAGLAMTFSSADSDGDAFANDGRQTFVVKNGSGSSVTVTFDSPNACNFGVVGSAHDIEVSVPAGQQRLIGPFDPGRFNDSEGKVNVSYSATSSIEVAVIE